MRRHFVAGSFYDKRAILAGDEVQRAIENEIMRDPSAGAVIPGTGGFRKLRVADPRRGKGKRGGYRVIYFDIPRNNRTYLLLLYDKDEQGDLSAEQKKALRAISAQLQMEN